MPVIHIPHRTPAALALALALATATATGCRQTSALYCETNTDCPADLPYCDVGGTTSASGGIRNTCVAAPDVDAGTPDGIDAGMEYELSVTVQGLGGTVVSDPAGIDCGKVCVASFPVGTVVTLTATPDAASAFTGWSGGCSGSAFTCDVTLDTATDVTARFEAIRVVQIASGGSHTCALLNSGAVRCWGANDRGQLGYGHTNPIGDDETPATAGDVEVGGTVIQVVAGGSHTCALLDMGAVRCWGDGGEGRLGYGNQETIGDDENPASAGDVAVGGTVKQISTTGEHTCALLETGAVRCWGFGDNGRLGYGNIEPIGDDETPAAAGSVFVGDSVVQIAAGNEHTCALLETSGARCWGSGDYGQLGYGNTDSIGDDETPATAGNVDVGGTVAHLVTGGDRTCAVLETGVLRCWGVNAFGGLGYGNTANIGDDETPATAGDVPVGGTVAQVAIGNHTCARLDTGAVRCWGTGASGQLGYGNTDTIGDDETPASVGVVDVGGTVVHLAAGVSHTCVVLDTGAARCWGHNFYGQLGYGHTDTIGDDEAPATAGDVPVF